MIIEGILADITVHGSIAVVEIETDGVTTYAKAETRLFLESVMEAFDDGQWERLASRDARSRPVEFVLVCADGGYAGPREGLRPAVDGFRPWACIARERP